MKIPPERSEDLLLGLLFCVAGAVPPVVALVRGDQWGAEATVGAGLVALGAAMVVSILRAGLHAGLQAGLQAGLHAEQAERPALAAEHAAHALAPAQPAARPRRAPAFSYVLAGALVAAPTVLCALVRSLFALPELAMIYVLVILIVAARYGRGPSILAAALGVASYDFFFIPPFYRLTVHDPRHLVTFGVMFAVGLVVGGLADRLRHTRKPSS